MKRFSIALLAAAYMALALNFPVFGQETDIFSYTIKDNEVTITDCSRSATVIEIPAELEGYPVTAIGEAAFNNCTNLTQVILPDTITEIGKYAFSGCTSLTSFTIPNGVTSIGDRAFYDCHSLTSITIPNGIINIGSFVFSGCKNLTQVILPDSLKEIGKYAFSSCTSLTSFTIPNSVTSIGEGAFDNCASLTAVDIPENVIDFEGFTFRWCTQLENINVDTNNAQFSSVDGVLYNKEKTVLLRYPPAKAQTTYTILDGVTDIGEKAFSDSLNLTAITLPESVVNIGEGAFSFCKSLSSVNIPYGAKSIGSSAFSHAENIESISLPNSIEDIGDGAFSWCTSLKTIKIPEGVTTVADSTFSGCTSLGSITIPNSVTYIGEDAFYNCTSLTSVTIPKSVEELDYAAFYKCGVTNLIFNSPSTAFQTTHTVTGGMNDQTIHQATFEGCDKLETIYGCAGSAAQAFAAELGINFVAKEEGDIIALPVSVQVQIHDEPRDFSAYSINGSNYFKLRDMAYMLRETDDRFEVIWDEEEAVIQLISGQPYTSVGNELDKGDGLYKIAEYTNPKINVDGKDVWVMAYNINGYNYFSLDDLMNIINLNTSEWMYL